MEYEEIVFEVFVKGKWTPYDFSGDITAEDKAWVQKVHSPVVLVAEGEYSVRVNGEVSGKLRKCFYRKR